MPFKKVMKGLPSEQTAAEGLMYHDKEALTPSQRACAARLGMTIQQEHEAYLLAHPEVRAMLEIFVSKMTRMRKRTDILQEAALHFVRPAEELDKEIRQRLNIPPKVPYTTQDKPTFKFRDLDLEVDLKNIIMAHYPPEPWKIPTPTTSTPDTVSSSFISIITSESTLPTPEPEPIPTPTVSQTFFGYVSTTVDKAIYLHVDDYSLRYDTAYVELMKAVEEAMEIPVIEIKKDIAELFYNAYKLFELNIMEKERIAAEIAWEKRMRKKLKRTIRRQENFRGYETPPTPKSEISSHESYKKPPQKPCICHPQYHYNRYPKDRFGIYLPRKEHYSDQNVTVTPAISIESLNVGEQPEDMKSVTSRKSTLSVKSAVSGKSAVSTKSAVSGKTALPEKFGGTTKTAETAKTAATTKTVESTELNATVKSTKTGKKAKIVEPQTA